MRLRLVTLNIWGQTEPLATRIDIAADELLKVGADVIALQEVAPWPGHAETTADELAVRLGMKCVAGHGLAILSRYDIESTDIEPLPCAAGEAEPRYLLSAALSIGGAAQLWVHTTHLDWRLDAGLSRERQVIAIDRRVRSQPSSLPQILCGDFNAEAESDEMRYLRGLTTLDGRRTYYQDAWLTAGGPGAGLTWSLANPHNHAGRTIARDRRIDYILVTPRERDGRGDVAFAALTCSEAVAGVCASDHYAVVADIQIRPSEPG